MTEMQLEELRQTIFQIAREIAEKIREYIRKITELIRESMKAAAELVEKMTDLRTSAAAVKDRKELKLMKAMRYTQQMKGIPIQSRCLRMHEAANLMKMKAMRVPRLRMMAMKNRKRAQ